MEPQLLAEDEQLLKQIWYKPSSGLASARVLYYTAKPRARGRFTMKLVEEWLKSQETYQLRKPTRAPRTVGAILAGSPRQIIQIDLIDMSAYSNVRANNGTHFVLVGYDIFSKKLYVVPMADKSEETTVNAVADLVEQMGRRPPKMLMSDNGLEFTNEGMKVLCDELGIKQLFSRPGNPRTNGYVERANGTLKRVIYKYMQAHDTRAYLPELANIVDRINRTPHRVTKLAPVVVDALPRGDPQLTEVKQRIYDSAAKRGTPVPEPQFQVGDEVRFQLVKGKLEKGGPNWSDYTLPVKDLVYPRNPYTPIRYRLANNEVYYAEELQLTPDIEESPERKDKRRRRREREAQAAAQAAPRPGLPRNRAPPQPAPPRPQRERRPPPGRPGMDEMIAEIRGRR